MATVFEDIATKQVRNPEIRDLLNTIIDFVGRKGTPVDAVASAVTIGTSTSVITLTSDVLGTSGDDISLEIVSATEDGALAVAYNATTKVITVTPERSTSDSTTGAELETALNADETISALITASAGGAGIMAEAAATNLESGVDATVAKEGATMIDASFIYKCTADCVITDTGKWVKATLASL